MATPYPPRATLAEFLAGGFRASWLTLLLIAAINTGLAALLWIPDTRPFWHPLVSVQVNGFLMAYCVNCVRPWESESPLLRLMLACAVGALIGFVAIVLIKQYSLAELTERPGYFALSVVTAFVNGLFISLIFYVRRREASAAAKLHRAEAERHLLAKQAVEAELKLMQAQVEPHFLFNTLASVQYLTETDPKQASALLGHLIGYLRAALPQLRASSSTLGREAELVRAYLSILKTRLGPRLDFAVDVPAALAAHPFPPNLLISLVENAIKHGIEPAADGGRIDVAAIVDGDALRIVVSDTGPGPVEGAPTAGHGVGLANVRERLAALYGARGAFALEGLAPRGTRAMLSVPYEAA